MKVLKFLIGVLVIGLMAFGAIMLIKKRQEADKNEAKATIYPIKVKSFTPKKEKVILTLPYFAEVKNDKDVIVNSKFAGKILYIKSLGSQVKKGEVVAKIDNSDLQAKLKEANLKIKSLEDKLKAEKLNLSNLLLTHKRTKELLEVKMASIEEYQQEENKIATLKASIKADINNIDTLKATKKSIVNNLSYTIIKSAIDGIVSAKEANKGDNVFPGKPILKISSKQGNYLLILLANPKKEIMYKHKLYKLIPLHQAINGLLAYKAKVDDDSLINSQKVDIDIVEFNGEGIKVPYDAVLSIDNKHYIFNPMQEIKEVKILAKGKNAVIINEGFDRMIVAKPDILLKIKAGYPIDVE